MAEQVPWFGRETKGRAAAHDAARRVHQNEFIAEKETEQRGGLGIPGVEAVGPGVVQAWPDGERAAVAPGLGTGFEKREGQAARVGVMGRRESGGAATEDVQRHGASPAGAAAGVAGAGVPYTKTSMRAPSRLTYGLW